MIDIKSLASICEKKAGSKGGDEKDLTKEEEELLLSASETGEFCYLSGEEISESWVRAGNKDFKDEKKPALSDTYLQAFKSLCERGYVTFQGGRFFMLNGSGLIKAKELRG